MKQISIIMITLTLAACAVSTPGLPEETTQTTGYTVASPVYIVEFAGKRATPAETAECKAAGGNVEPQGLLGADFCVIPFPDAGQICTDGAECIGDCRADPSLDSGETMNATTGVCQANNSPFGCYAVIENGQGTPMLCVD